MKKRVLADARGTKLFWRSANCMFERLGAIGIGPLAMLALRSCSPDTPTTLPKRPARKSAPLTAVTPVGTREFR